MEGTPTLTLLRLTLSLCLLALIGIRAYGAEGSGGLLFTGLDPAFQFEAAEFGDPGWGASSLRSELVGIIIDGREIDTELVYRTTEKFYLPATLLGAMGVQGSARNGRLYLQTPGGEVETDRRFFRDIEGEMFFVEDLLDEVLRIRWEFSSEKYAFTLTLPWWQQREATGDLFADEGDPDIDFQPSTFGVTQLRLDHTQFADRHNNFSYTDLLLRGRFADGVWRGEVLSQQDRDVWARDYYWLKDFDHVQALVGNQQVLINPLLPTIETTGAQALYSSNELKFDPYQDQTRSQYIRRFGIPSKEIEGISQPGAIAELRVSGRPVARVRVKLDGTYRFPELRSNSLQFETVRVHILDQRSMIELDVQDFTRTPIDLLLDQGQAVAFGGAGAQGNPLDPVRGTRGGAAYGLIRYGLTDRLTVEAGMQTADGVLHEVAGLTASFGRRWATTLSFGNHEGAFGTTMDLYGRGERWQLTARSQHYSEGFRTQLSPESRFNDLRYEYWLTPRISVGAQGRSTESGSYGADYLLPGFSWRFNRRNILRVWPDVDGSYRVDLRTAHRQQDWFEFVHDSSGDKVEYRYFKNPSLEYFGRVKQHSLTNTTTAEVGAVWYPREYDDRAYLHASLLSSGGAVGYRFIWETTVLPGLFSHLEFRDEATETEYADPGMQLRWTLSLDLAIAGGRPIPARNDFIQSRAGSIGGRLTLENGARLQSEGIDQVAILIDGRPYTAVLRGKNFFVRNVQPGVHEVALSSEYLPMSLSPEKITYRVRVVPAATTSVDFVLKHEYGISGRVTSPDMAPLSNVLVEVVGSDGFPVGSVRTDEYGYYRFSGLAAGQYVLRVSSETGDSAEQELHIEDAYLFDADIELALARADE